MQCAGAVACNATHWRILVVCSAGLAVSPDALVRVESLIELRSAGWFGLCADERNISRSRTLVSARMFANFIRKFCGCRRQIGGRAAIDKAGFRMHPEANARMSLAAVKKQHL